MQVMKIRQNPWAVQNISSNWYQSPQKCLKYICARVCHTHLSHPLLSLRRASFHPFSAYSHKVSKTTNFAPQSLQAQNAYAMRLSPPAFPRYASHTPHHRKLRRIFLRKSSESCLSCGSDNPAASMVIRSSVMCPAFSSLPYKRVLVRKHSWYH